MDTYQWEVLFTNQTVNADANYTTPYPGGVSSSSMVIIDSDIYIFGGYSFRL